MIIRLLTKNKFSIINIDKITEIFCLIDDFCQEFDKAKEGHILAHTTLKKSRNRTYKLSYSYEFGNEFAKRYIPANRVGKVTDIAPITLFLVSDAAKYITDKTIVIDGGQLAGQKPWDWLLGEIKI